MYHTRCQVTQEGSCKWDVSDGEWPPPKKSNMREKRCPIRGRWKNRLEMSQNGPPVQDLLDGMSMSNVHVQLLVWHSHPWVSQVPQTEAANTKVLTDCFPVFSLCLVIFWPILKLGIPLPRNLLLSPASNHSLRSAYLGGWDLSGRVRSSPAKELHNSHLEGLHQKMPRDKYLRKYSPESFLVKPEAWYTSADVEVSVPLCRVRLVPATVTDSLVWKNLEVGPYMDSLPPPWWLLRLRDHQVPWWFGGGSSGWGFPGGSDGKESTCHAGDLSLIPGSGRSPGKGNGNPLQYSCLKNSMDRGAWKAIFQGVTKS